MKTITVEAPTTLEEAIAVAQSALDQVEAYYRSIGVARDTKNNEVRLSRGIVYWLQQTLALREERDRLREALDELVHECWDSGAVDTEAFESIGLKHGVLVKVPASDAFREFVDEEAEWMIDVAWLYPTTTPEEDA